MRSKLDAVKEIAKTATTTVVKTAAETAVRSGSESALNRALVEAKRYGMTLHVVNIANEQLGYPTNDTSR